MSKPKKQVKRKKPDVEKTTLVMPKKGWGNKILKKERSKETKKLTDAGRLPKPAPAAKKAKDQVKTASLPKKFPEPMEKTCNAIADKLIVPKLGRDKLMGIAKEKGVKNYRVLNKAELTEVVKTDATQETVDRVVKGAVDRWQAGWGHKGGRVHKKRREYRIIKGGKK